jgi:hypothetical protein
VTLEDLGATVIAVLVQALGIGVIYWLYQRLRR